MYKLYNIDSQLNDYLFGNNYSIFALDASRYSQVWELFKNYTMTNMPEHFLDFENIQNLVSLLWSNYPNQNDRIEAFYRYRKYFPRTYHWIINVTFPIRNELFPHGYAYRQAIEELIVNCLID